ASLRLLGHALDVELRLDDLGLREHILRHGLHLTRMGPATSSAYALLGAAMLLSRHARSALAAQLLALLALLIGWLGLTRFLFGGVPLLPFATMAMRTALVIVFLAGGVLMLNPEVGIAALLRSPGPGGGSARRLMPAALVVPLLAGILTLEAHHARLFAVEQAFALFALSTLLTLGGAVWLTGAQLERVDADRRQAARSVSESQRLLQAIIDGAPLVVRVKDLLGRYLLVNREFERETGRSRDEVRGRTDDELFAGPAAPGLPRLDATTVGETRLLDLVKPPGNGDRIFLSSAGSLHDEDGERFAVFGVAADVTLQKRAEARLLMQVERLNLLDQTTRAVGEHRDLASIFRVVLLSLEEHLAADFGCICLCQPDRTRLQIRSVGDRSRALALELGLTERSEITVDGNGLGRCLRGELVYEPEIAGSAYPLPALLARGGLESLVIAPLKLHEDVFGVLLVACRAAGAYSSTDCEFLRQLSTHLALATHQGQLHERLQAAYDHLRDSQEEIVRRERLSALGRLARGIAHDVNNVITPAALYADELLEHEENLSAGTRERLEVIRRAIRDVGQTVSRLHDVYRERQADRAVEAVNLNAMVAQVVELTRARWRDWPERDGVVVALITDLADDLPRVDAVESEIRDALTNLVLNAVDAMPGGGTLTLRTRLRGAGSAENRPAGEPRVVLEVIDTGIGMSEEVQNRCLEPFYTTKGERGTGLGLVMVHSLVERRGATMQIESAPNAGTTVRLMFPAGTAAARAERPGPALVARPLHILLVDDDALILRTLRNILALDGHRIEVAAGGQLGIDAFRVACGSADSFDLVITDLGMPTVDGRAVAAAVKALSAATPVMLLTGWGESLRQDRPTYPHIDYVLGKPPRIDELRRALVELKGGTAPH
ncbi:MAG: response regulator, partial [Gammaproteobacteria bacterium]|nr:response regulator [Gammaproteobacteria bacterium]